MVVTASVAVAAVVEAEFIFGSSVLRGSRGCGCIAARTNEGSPAVLVADVVASTVVVVAVLVVVVLLS